MKNRWILYKAAVGLLLALAVTAPTSFGATSPVVASKYSSSDKTFDFQFQQNVSTIKSANLAVECGLVPPSARSAALAAMASDLLREAQVDYGDGKGNISFHGAAEFYQAINAVFGLDSMMSLQAGGGHKKPDRETCSLVAQSGVSAALNKLIASGL